MKKEKKSSSSSKKKAVKKKKSKKEEENKKKEKKESKAETVIRKLEKRVKGKKKGKKRAKGKKLARKSKKEARKFLTPNKVKVGASFVLLFLALAAFSLYYIGPLEKYTYPIYKQVPFPVVLVGEERAVVTSRDLVHNTEAVKKFYESQDFASQGMRVDFSTKEGKERLEIKQKDVLDKLIENKIVEQTANDQGIYISRKEAEEEVDEKIKQYGDRKELELSLESLYGWSIDDFRDEVVLYQMYLKKLFERYQEKATSREDYAKIMRAKNALRKDSDNFEEVVKKYSEGESVKNDGQLGWFGKEQLIQEVANVVYEMEKGAVSGVIVSPLGYHIVRLNDLKEIETKNEKGESATVKQVQISQIFIRGESFIDWVTEQKKKTKVKVLMHDYHWDESEGQLQFRDPAMQKTEKKLRVKSEGDPSL